MAAALMIGAGGTATVQAKGDRDRGSCREVHAKKDGDKRMHARRDQGSRGSQARRGFGGPRGSMASRSHQGSGGSKAQHARGGQKGQPREKIRRDGQGRPGSNPKARGGKRGGDKNRGGGRGSLKEPRSTSLDFGPLGRVSFDAYQVLNFLRVGMFKACLPLFCWEVFSPFLVGRRILPSAPGSHI